MGRPLKIAKAVVLTWTGSDGSTDIATVAENLYNLDIIAGMPFVLSTTTAGLTAGVTYWILNVLSANTFTVSATELSANPNSTKQNIIYSGPVTVPMTVGGIDTGFNNPAGTANTYSVVGGNTTIYGSQVLPTVAIGQNGTGTLYTVSTSNANLFGQGTDLANTIVAGSAIQAAVANNNGGTDYVNVGFASATIGVIAVAVANTSASGNIIATTGDATLLTVNQPTTFSANLGGLVTGKTYFVKNIANTEAFTVSETLGGAVFGLSTEVGTPDAQQDRVVLTANPPITFANAGYVFANDEAGYIVRQKGKQKYLVKGLTTGLTAACYTANVAGSGLTPNTFNITATYANAATSFVQSLSDHTLEIFANDNTLPNSVPAFATFNTAYAANTYGGQPYPIVTITKS